MLMQQSSLACHGQIGERFAAAKSLFPEAVIQSLEIGPNPSQPFATHGPDATYAEDKAAFLSVLGNFNQTC